MTTNKTGAPTWDVAGPLLLRALYNVIDKLGGPAFQELLPPGYQPTCCVGALESARAAIKAAPAGGANHDQ